MRILVIGCVSEDIIHLEQSSKTIHCLGGAGFYTATAASAAGSAVTLLAPRLNGDLPFVANQEFGFEWIGPLIEIADFPKLEIRHHGNDRATLCAASWGAESMLRPELLPADLSDYSIVHIAALSSAERQLEFLRALKSRSSCKISIGTYARLAYGQTELLREMIKSCDFVFMNENEAKAVYEPETFPLTSRDGQIICITYGKNGAVVYSSDNKLQLAGLHVVEFDPTGAGDTFAGTLLGSLAQNKSIEESSELALKRSALVITAGGADAIRALEQA